MFKTHLTTVALVFSLLLAVDVNAAKIARLSENKAIDLLSHTIKRDGVYSKRIDSSCISYVTEETTRANFEFAIREIHNSVCGGDPGVSPVIDRYRVNRTTHKIEWLELASGNWLPYQSAVVK